MSRQATDVIIAHKPHSGPHLFLIDLSQNQKNHYYHTTFVRTFSPSLVPLTSSQPNIRRQLRAQSVRSLQDRIPHRQQLWSLAMVFHLAEPFCPLLSWNVNTQVQPGKTRLRTEPKSPTYVIAHNARFIRAFSHASVYS
jgi:hypothetical protein